MNPRNNKAEWFRYAKMYARAASFLMEKTPPVHNTVCYLSFLSAECSMKGFLLQNHLRPVPDTHNLRELCQACAWFEDEFSSLLDDCEALGRFATPSGFPTLEAVQRRSNWSWRAWRSVRFVLPFPILSSMWRTIPAAL